MSSDRLIYSLPNKTQPTLSSSSKSRIMTRDKIYYQNLNTSPEVSAFTTDDR